uniref:KOW domain-containing protein n=1 Tax=Quercus lobata TaxID=97700 RepID=A0A7N2QYF4_QUELO
MGWKAAQKLIRHWKIVRGDNVMIIRGKDKGETGLIKRVIRSQNRVIVEGKNLVKKHIKQGQGHEGGIFTVEAPLHASNVQVVDPVTGKPCKLGTRYLEDGSKVRVSRGLGASGSIIPRPEILKIRTTPRPTVGRIHDNTRHIRHKPCDVRLEVTALLFRLRTPHSIYLKEEYAAVGNDRNDKILNVVCLKAGPKDTPMDLVLEKTYDPKTGMGMPGL